MLDFKTPTVFAPFWELRPRSSHSKKANEGGRSAGCAAPGAAAAQGPPAPRALPALQPRTLSCPFLLSVFLKAMFLRLQKTQPQKPSSAVKKRHKLASSDGFEAPAGSRPLRPLRPHPAATHGRPSVRGRPEPWKRPLKVSCEVSGLRGDELWVTHPQTLSTGLIACLLLVFDFHFLSPHQRGQAALPRAARASSPGGAPLGAVGGPVPCVSASAHPGVCLGSGKAALPGETWGLGPRCLRTLRERLAGCRETATFLGRASRQTDKHESQPRVRLQGRLLFHGLLLGPGQRPGGGQTGTQRKKGRTED